MYLGTYIPQNLPKKIDVTLLLFFKQYKDIIISLHIRDMSSNDEIYEIIKAKREERNKDLSDTSRRKSQPLSGSSLKKYGSVIRSLYKALAIDEPLTSDYFVKHKEKIRELLAEKPSSSRRHIYTALSVFTNDLDFIRFMSNDVKDYKNVMKSRQLTERQKANWMTKKDILNILDDYKFRANDIYAKHAEGHKLSFTDYETLQNYIILLVMSDKYMPIRRTLDWIAFKTSNINPTEDNYMTDDYTALVFNKYKNMYSQGAQRLTFSNYKKRNSTRQEWDFKTKKGAEIIRDELKKYAEINPEDYLLFNKNYQALSPTNFTNRLNRIFGKKVSTNMLRNILKTEEAGRTMNALETSMRSMVAGGSSPEMLMTYVKNLMKDYKDYK